MRSKFLAILPVAGLLSMAGSAGAAVVYNGNGATGFGGVVGPGNITVSDTTAGLTLTVNRGPGGFGNNLAVYLDTQAGGFANTSSFTDNADLGRASLSGLANDGSGNRSTVVFAPGFGADYGIAVENSFIGVFQLQANGSFNFLFGQNESGNANDPSFSITLTPAQLNQIGINSVGQTFGFDATYLNSSNAFRSNETVGATNPDISTQGNPGQGSTITFASADTYTTTAVPEPASLGLLTAGGLLSLGRRRTRRV